HIDRAIRADGQRSDFALGGFVENEALSRGTSFILAKGTCWTAEAEHTAAWFGASDQICLAVKGQHANVGFIAGIEKFALAVGRYRENLSLVAGRDVQGAIGAEFDVPDIFGLRVEKDGFFAG